LSLASRRKEELNLEGVRKRPIRDPPFVRHLEESGAVTLNGLSDWGVLKSRSTLS